MRECGHWLGCTEWNATVYNEASPQRMNEDIEADEFIIICWGVCIEFSSERVRIIAIIEGHKYIRNSVRESGADCGVMECLLFISISATIHCGRCQIRVALDVDLNGFCSNWLYFGMCVCV